MKMTQFRRDALPMFGLLLFALLWFMAIEWMFPRYFLWDDNATFYLPSALLNFETLRTELSIPIINFYQFAGWNHINAGQMGTLYPPAYLAAWFVEEILHAPLLTIDVLCIAHMTIGMLGMYAWLRLLETRRSFAMGGALFYLTLPFSTILSKSWLFVAYAHCYIPICFFLLESNLRRSSPTACGVYIIVKSLYLYTGYPQYVVYLSLFELLYIAIRGKALQKPIVWKKYVLSNALVAALCLPVLLPMAEATILSESRHLPFSLFATIQKYLLLTDALAEQVLLYRPDYLGHINIFHIGASVLTPWILCKAVQSRKPIPAFIHGLGLLSLLALLLCTPFYAIISWLPIVSHFRWPFKIFIFFGFFYTTALVLLLQWMHAKKILPAKHILLITIVALCSHVAVLRSPALGNWSITHISTLPSRLTDTAYRITGVSAQEIHRLPWLYESLPSFNFPSIWKTPVITGYDTLASRLHSNINTRSTNASGLFDPDVLPLLMEHLSRWSVRFLVSREILSGEILRQTSLRRIPSDPSVFIYENARAMPVAAFVNAPMDPLSIEYHANRIRIQTNKKTGTVFLRVAPIAGYRMILPEGSEQSLTLVESGVILPIEHTQDFVDIIYQSAALDRGIFLACIGAILGMMVFVIALFDRMKFTRK